MPNHQASKAALPFFPLSILLSSPSLVFACLSLFSPLQLQSTNPPISPLLLKSISSFLVLCRPSLSPFPFQSLLSFRFSLFRSQLPFLFRSLLLFDFPISCAFFNSVSGVRHKLCCFSQSLELPRVRVPLQLTSSRTKLVRTELTDVMAGAKCRARASLPQPTQTCKNETLSLQHHSQTGIYKEKKKKTNRKEHTSHFYCPSQDKFSIRSIKKNFFHFRNLELELRRTLPSTPDHSSRRESISMSLHPHQFLIILLPSLSPLTYIPNPPHPIKPT